MVFAIVSTDLSRAVRKSFTCPTTGWARVTGTPPLAPLEAVRMARKHMFVSYEKAKRELGFEPSPVEGALRRAVEWFQANGYC